MSCDVAIFTANKLKRGRDRVTRMTNRSSLIFHYFVMSFADHVSSCRRHLVRNRSVAKRQRLEAGDAGEKAAIDREE